MNQNNKAITKFIVTLDFHPDRWRKANLTKDDIVSMLEHGLIDAGVKMDVMPCSSKVDEIMEKLRNVEQ